MHIDCDFEAGNIGDIYKVASNEYELTLRADPVTKTRIWFWFNVSDAPIGKPVTFHLLGITKKATSFSTAQRVMVQSESNPKWCLIPKENQCYEIKDKFICRSPNPVLSFSYKFERKEKYQFCYFYPWTYSDQIRFLEDFCNESLSIQSTEEPEYNYQVKFDTLGYSVQKRMIPYVQFGNGPFQVLLVGRQHAGETQGSLLLQTVLEELKKQSRSQLLANATISVVPMLNVDGVALGNYRVNATGIDTNRDFGPFSKTPEAECLRQLIQELVNNADTYTAEDELSDFKISLENESSANLSLPTHTVRTQGQNFRESKYVDPDREAIKRKFLLIDIHGHSNYSGSFLFVNDDLDPTQLVFPSLLLNKTKAFKEIHSDSRDSVRNTLRRSMRYNGFVYSLELGTCGPDPLQSGSNPVRFENQCCADSLESQSTCETHDELSKSVPYTPQHFKIFAIYLLDAIQEFTSLCQKKQSNQ